MLTKGFEDMFVFWVKIYGVFQQSLDTKYLIYWDV